MTLQYSTAVRNAKLDAVEVATGTAAILRLYTGSVPATPATAVSGTKVSEMTLPTDWMNAASAAAKTKLGTWQDTNAPNAGSAGYFRIYASDGTTCHMQGTVTATGGGGDMTIDNIVIAAGQTVTVTGFTLADNNG